MVSDVQVAALRIVRIVLVMDRLRLPSWEMELLQSGKGHHDAGMWLFHEERVMLKGGVY